ncbi:hypothetical protein EBU71_06040, partial [bacterium]|nr:hypothetical protein [Candidatus Elulimicrobium humile]
HAKSSQYAKWKADHWDRFTKEEVEHIEEKKLTSLQKFRKASSEREKKHADIEKQSKEKPDMKGAIDRLEKHLNKEAADAGVSKTKETSFHKKLDKLVHSTFGKRKDEMKMKEEAEQIDELNYDTVKSLYKKRRDDFHGDQVGKKKKGKEISAKNVSRSISRLMGSKPTQKEETEQIDELKKSTLASYKDKSTASLKNAQMNRDAAEAGKHMAKGFADLHAKSDAIAKKRVKGLKGYMQRKQGMKPTSEETVSEVYATGVQGHVSQAALDSIKGKRSVKVNLGTPSYSPKPKTLAKKPSKKASFISKLLNREDTYQDSYAATQTTGMEIADLPPEEKVRKREMSKSARMIKALYKKHNVVKEELYDHEKEDKSVATYGKKPTMVKAEKKLGMAENQPQAAAVLTGGKTLTGQTRDTLEIDPLMRKPGPPIDQKQKSITR